MSDGNPATNLEVSTMREALSELFKAFTVLFKGFNSGAQAVGNLATIAEEETGIMLDESRNRRAAALNAQQA